MKIRTLVVFFSIALLFSNLAISQNYYLPENKYKEDKEDNVFGNVYKVTRIDVKGYSFSYGYLHTQFMNSRYAALTEGKLLKQTYGHVFSLRQPIYPVFLDFNIFKSFYETDMNLTVPNSKLSFRGIDFSLSLALFPISFNIARIIMPYVGIGYQLAGIMESKSYFTLFSDSSIYSLAKVKQSFWKVGLMINPVRRLILNFEYRQSMFLKKENAINQFFITIGYRFYKDLYLIRLFTKNYK